MSEQEAEQRRNLMPGDELHGFILESIDVLEDYHGYGYFFRHRISGMEVYHVANEDPENFFGFIFKTPPVNDCGTPHIIEHCILAGSERYPVRDPFMSLLKGSANTFMNAMTYPDYTVYPAASPLEKDFSHLFSVYADAVFSPLLREETFWQEGIRITADESGELKFDGVVFNEMLGELSDHDSIVGRQSIRSLYPDTPYFFESGGDPEHIIRLNYRQFAGYYASHYHPSNCRLFLYGDQDVTKRLALLDDRYLSDMSAMSISGPTLLAKPWNKPKTVSVTSPAQGDLQQNNDATVTVSWATTCVEDPIEVLTLTTLVDILLGNPGAPLYKAIIDSHLSKDISQISGMDTSFRQMPFTVGFKGIDPARAQEAEQLVLDTLTTIVKQGIPTSLVQNAIKRQEFQLQEITGDAPMGLRAMSRAVRGWLQGKAPHVTVGVRSSLLKLKQMVDEAAQQDGALFAENERGYFEQWIQKNLLDNPHRCLLIVKPDGAHNRMLEQSLNQRLDEVKASLGKDGLAQLQEHTRRFEQFEAQKDSPEALATIPVLRKEDLPETIRTLPQQLQSVAGVPVYVQGMDSNGIVYTDGLFSAGSLNESEQLLLPLFVRLLHMTGVNGVPYDEMAVRIRQTMGGLYFFLESSSMLTESDVSRSGLVFRMKSLARDHEASLKLLSEILSHADVADPERIGAVVNDLVSDFESNVAGSGQLFASQRASSHFSPVLWQNELWNGIAQWLHLVKLDIEDHETVTRLGEELTSLQRKLIDRDRLIMHLCTDDSLLDEAATRMIGFAESLHASTGLVKSGAEQLIPFTEEQASSVELFTIPSSVSFSALVCRAAEPVDPVQTHETVLAHIITTNHLWEQVRGVGGAYGVSAHVDVLERLFAFSSYRDPRVEGTLQDFVSVLERIAEHGVQQELLDSAIVSIIARELRPLYPKNASMIAFRRALYEISDTFRAERRSWTLETTVDDIRRAAKTLLQSIENTSAVSSIAGEKMLERESKKSERLRGVKPIRLPL